MTPREAIKESDRLKNLAEEALTWVRYMRNMENIDTQPNDRHPANVRVNNRVMPLHVREAAMPALLAYAEDLEGQATALENRILVLALDE